MRKEPLKILIIGAYGVDNWGDEAILDRILYETRQIIPEAEFRVLSGNPIRTEALHGIEAAFFFPIARGFFNFSKIRKTLGFLFWADVVVLGGGGLFHDIRSKATILWGMQCWVVSLFRKPLFVWGISVGPLRRQFFQWLTKKALQKAKQITVRDRTSYSLLAGLGISDRKINVTADPGLLLPDRKIITKKKKVVLSLCPSTFLQKDFSLVISRFVGYLTGQGYQIELLVMQTHGEYPDPYLAMQLAQNFPIFKPQVLDEAIEHIAEARVLVGMRLHSLVLAATQKVPFMALSYAPKVMAFCNEIGAGEFMIPAGKINLNVLKKIFKKLIEGSPRLKTPELKKRATITKKLFKEFLQEQNLL